MNEVKDVLPSEEFGNLVIVPFQVLVKDREVPLCLNVQKILEVVELSDYLPLPDMQAPFVGIFDHRIGPVPILDLKSLLAKEIDALEGFTSKRPQTSNLLPKRLIFAELHGMAIGLIVDESKRIEAVKNKHVYPVPRAIQRSRARLFNGVVKVAKKLILMLDIEQILQDLGVESDPLAEDRPSHESPLKGKQVLIVEDSKTFAKQLGSMLQPLGALLTFAEDGRRGYEILKANPSQFDLILTDIEMPRMNGIEMTRMLRSLEGFETPIIFHSSISNPALIDQIRTEQLGEYLVAVPKL